jgi:hypothetical protein
MQVRRADLLAFVGERGRLAIRLFGVCLAIIAVNCIVGMFVPITDCLSDDFWLLNDVWHVVLGQKLGVDYHDALGFGVSQVGAIVWRILPPGGHAYTLRLTDAVFNAGVIACAVLVAVRVFRTRKYLAWVFCIPLALFLSSSSIDGSLLAFGSSMFFDRLAEGVLAVLLLHVMAAKPVRAPCFDPIMAAVLLNLLFLVKVSGFLIGLPVVVVGIFSSNTFKDGLRVLGAALALLAILLVLDFLLTGLSPGLVLREYVLPARARGEPDLSLLVHALVNRTLWGSAALLFVFSCFQRPQPGTFLRRLLLPAVYAFCQVGIHLSNSLEPGLIMASALVALQLDTIPERKRPFLPRHWPLSAGETARLRILPVFDLIPYAFAFLVVCIQLRAMAIGSFLGVLAVTGHSADVVMAGDGEALWRLKLGINQTQDDFAVSIRDGAEIIKGLHADKNVIATLDFTNPFPLLFGTTPPQGTWNWLEVKSNVPIGYMPKSGEVIGNACIVMLPLSPDMPITTELFTRATAPALAHDFVLAKQDKWWRVYRRTGCAPGVKAA